MIHLHLGLCLALLFYAAPPWVFWPVAALAVAVLVWARRLERDLRTPLRS